MRPGLAWGAVVVTCPRQAWVAAIQMEVEAALVRAGCRGEVLVVADPGQGGGGGGGGVGSGGATLNALLVLTEHLSARAGHTTILPELLAQTKVRPDT